MWLAPASPVLLADRLDVWDVRAEDFPAAGRSADQLEFLLRYAILAPSTRNTQPWLFKVRLDTVELYADRSRGLPVSDPDDRLLTISCGAALQNFVTAARRFGHKACVAAFPRPAREDLLAEIGLGKALVPTDEDMRLFDAIALRRTNRQPFDPRTIDDDVIAELCDAAAAHGATFTPLSGNDKQAACALVSEGDRVQYGDKRFRRELAAWVVPNRSDRRDGVPGYAVGFNDFLSYVGPMLIRTFDGGDKQAARYEHLAAGSPLLAVLCTDSDEPHDWLAAGRALERVLLLGTSRGLDASFLNQPVEVVELRPRLAELCCPQRYPQMLIRMGTGPAVCPTPRRELSDVLLGAGAWL